MTNHYHDNCCVQRVPYYSGSGPIQLWRFLLQLLMDTTCQGFISWTGNGYEFKMSDPEEVLSLLLLLSYIYNLKSPI